MDLSLKIDVVENISREEFDKKYFIAIQTGKEFSPGSHDCEKLPPRCHHRGWGLFQFSRVAIWPGKRNSHIHS